MEELINGYKQKNTHLRTENSKLSDRLQRTMFEAQRMVDSERNQFTLVREK